MNNTLITELSSGKILLRQEAFTLMESLINGNDREEDSKKPFSVRIAGAVNADELDSAEASDSINEKSVLIIPIIGAMMKYDSWFSYGMDHYASILAQAESSDNIIGTVLLINTPGGSTQSLLQIEKVLAGRTKPCIAVIDGMCCSCGIHVAAMCDKIYAESRMCEVGSIGVFAQLVDDRKALESYGYKLIEVYPPESSYKNKGVREAIEGNPQYLIDETLTPFALDFQIHIRTHRPNLDEKVEGILEGRVFYAYDAVENGLIDKIATLEDAVQEIYGMTEISDARKIIDSVFNQ